MPARIDRRRFCIVASAAMLYPAITRAETGPLGRTIVTPLPSAPFPHSSRAGGHDYNDVHYDPLTYYSDSSVGIYVPQRFRPTRTTDLIVHFHGWNNHVAEVFVRYRLREQVDASAVNAVLVVPQGPKDAPDSGDGKLELDPGGFARFVADVGETLRKNGITPTSNIRRIALTAHSGGYGGAGGVLARGGMNDAIVDVLLFDAAYGYFDAFANWAKSSRNHHLLSLFTDDTSNGNALLMASLQGARPFTVRNTNAMTLAELQTRDPAFLVTTDVVHDELMQKRDWYALFLRTTDLAR